MLYRGAKTRKITIMFHLILSKLYPPFPSCFKENVKKKILMFVNVSFNLLSLS